MNFKLKVCYRCGTEFLPTSGNQKYCQTCIPIADKERKRKYYLKNKEKYIEQHKKYRKSHKKDYIRYSREWNQKLKIKYIKILGGKCNNCNISLDRNNACIFDFHHINNEDKESAHEYRTKDFETKIKEGKIELLCSNCHRLVHHSN